MKKIVCTTTLLMLTWISGAMAAGEEAYTFGQGLQALVRQQQVRPDADPSPERLYFIPAQPKDETPAKDEKAASGTINKVH